MSEHKVTLPAPITTFRWCQFLGDGGYAVMRTTEQLVAWVPTQYDAQRLAETLAAEWKKEK